MEKKFALSVLNPISYLICLGIKTVENRSWTTDYRGRIYIHSSGPEEFSIIDKSFYPKDYLKKLEKLMKLPTIQNVDDFDEVVEVLKSENKYDEYKEVMEITEKFNTYYDRATSYYGFDFFKDDDSPEYLAKCNKILQNKEYFHKNFSIIGHVDLVDIVKDSKSVWAEKNMYHWILENPVLYDTPLINVKGKLRLFDVTHII